MLLLGVMYRLRRRTPFLFGPLGCGGLSVSAPGSGGSSRYGVGSNMGMRWGVVRFSDLECWSSSWSTGDALEPENGVFEKPKGASWIAAGCWGSWARRECECIRGSPSESLAIGSCVFRHSFHVATATFAILTGSTSITSPGVTASREIGHCNHLYY